MRGPGCGNREGRGPLGAGAVAAAWHPCAPPGGQGSLPVGSQGHIPGVQHHPPPQLLGSGANESVCPETLDQSEHACLSQEAALTDGRVHLVAVPGPAALRRLNGPQASPASSPSSLPLAGSQGAIWLCPEDNWTQFPHWHFRGPGHHGLGQDWFMKECSLFLENDKHYGPQQPGPAPLPPCSLGSPGTSLWPVGTAPRYWAWMQTKASE